MKHLFSLCENKVSTPATAAAAPLADLDENGEEVAPAAPAQSHAGSDAVLAMVRATTAAALSKELLKLGSSKLEKAIDKEYVKIFTTLALETWIDNYDVSFCCILRKESFRKGSLRCKLNWGFIFISIL